MFSFGKRAPRSALPAALQGSVLLTTGLQGAIRSQYIIAGMTAFGMILGAVLAAWLVAFAPGAWDALTFSAPGSTTLNVLNWISRGLGVLMGAVVFGAFFRHVTYTVVAKSLLALKQRPDITEAERAWLNFELASMVQDLKKSDWGTNQHFMLAFVTLIWFGIAFFALTGLTVFSDESMLMTLQLFVFLASFITGWFLIYRAPAAMPACDFADAAHQVTVKLDTTEPVTAVLAHAKPYSDLTGAVVCLAVFALAFGGVTRILDTEIQTTARTEAVASTLRQVLENIETAQGAQRDDLLVSLGNSQYHGGKTKWAVFSDLGAAVSKQTPFVANDCVSLNDASSGPWLCSRLKDEPTLLLTKLFVGKLPETEWHRFFFARPVPTP